MQHRVPSPQFLDDLCLLYLLNEVLERRVAPVLLQARPLPLQLQHGPLVLLECSRLHNEAALHQHVGRRVVGEQGQVADHVAAPVAHQLFQEELCAYVSPVIGGSKTQVSLHIVNTSKSVCVCFFFTFFRYHHSPGHSA